MGRRGRKRRLAVEVEYWRLIGSGLARWRPVAGSGSVATPGTVGVPNAGAFRPARPTSPRRVAIKGRPKGGCVVGAPVRGSSGRVIASIAAVAPPDRFGQTERKRLSDAGQENSIALSETSATSSDLDHVAQRQVEAVTCASVPLMLLN